LIHPHLVFETYPIDLKTDYQNYEILTIYPANNIDRLLQHYRETRRKQWKRYTRL